MSAAGSRLLSLARAGASSLPKASIRSSRCLRRPAAFIPAQRCFSTSSILFEKKYTKDHEWVELDSDGTTGTIGLTTYAAKALGDVVFVELPQVDLEVSQGDTLGAVESVKSASDILSPVSGVVLEANSALEDEASMVNKSPEGNAWICKIKVTQPKELDELMDAAAYAEHTGE